MILSILIATNSKLKKKKYKIQAGKIKYSDLNKPARPLYSKKYQLSGKPDYIIKSKKKYIPIELKTGKSNEPLKNHIYQLATYCVLVEENFNSFVPYGILIYNNNFEYKISFNPKLRFELENSINKIRNVIKTTKVFRNHNDINKCRNCSMKKYCNQKLI